MLKITACYVMKIRMGLQDFIWRTHVAVCNCVTTMSLENGVRYQSSVSLFIYLFIVYVIYLSVAQNTTVMTEYDTLKFRQRKNYSSSTK